MRRRSSAAPPIQCCPVDPVVPRTSLAVARTAVLLRCGYADVAGECRAFLPVADVNLGLFHGRRVPRRPVYATWCAMNEFPIMALVSSAGGLDATATILARLPSDLPAAADHRTSGAV
jgi:hypothetical protein